MSDEKDSKADESSPVVEDKLVSEAKEESKTTEKVSEAKSKESVDTAVGSSAEGDPIIPKQQHKPKVRTYQAGVAHVKSTFNNTKVSITDINGGVVSWSNAGRVGFKGSRKSTAFAATMVGQESAKQAIAKGIREVEIRVQGAGAGRESAIRAIQAAGMSITVIKDVTPIPHNGCRARKRRRV